MLMNFVFIALLSINTLMWKFYTLLCDHSVLLLGKQVLKLTHKDLFNLGYNWLSFYTQHGLPPS